jgi:hypothetical protein
MANEIQISSNFSVRNGSLLPSLQLSNQLSISSSYSFSSVYPQTLTTASWIALNTGSATNKQLLVIANQSPSGSAITIATSANGSGSFTTLKPSAFTMLPTSQSYNYYVFASAGVSGSGLGELVIGITE